MATTQYIGARYVPLFADPLEWDKTMEYEPLTIVSYQGNSYTSRQAVPSNIEITDEKFWALTGNYNAQVEAYRKEVAQYGEAVTQNSKDIAAEILRATDVETTLSTKIGTVESELTQNISDTADKITEGYKAADSAVETAYKAADSAIETAYKAADSNLQSEINAIHEVDTDLETRISNNKQDIAAINNTLPKIVNGTSKLFNEIEIQISTDFKGAQGACFIDSDTIVFYEANEKTLYKYNKNNATLIDSASIDIGHGNSLAFNKTKNIIYAFGNFDSTVPNRLYIIDAATLKMSQYIDLNIGGADAQLNCYAMTFDNTTHNIITCGSFQHVVSNKPVCEVNIFNSDFEKQKSFNLPISQSGNISCITAKNGSIYFYTSEFGNNTLFVVDANTAKVSYIYEVSQNADNNFIAEVEAIDFVDSDLYIFALAYNSKIKFISKLGYSAYNALVKEFQDEMVVYVDETLSNATYCNGTENAPFNKIENALACTNFCSELHVELLSDVDSCCYTAPLVGSVTLKGLGKTVSNLQFGYANSLLIRDCMNIATLNTRVSTESEGNNVGTITVVGGSYTSNASVIIERTIVRSFVAFPDFANCGMFGGAELTFYSDAGEHIYRKTLPTSKPALNAKNINNFGLYGSLITEGSYIPCGTYAGTLNNGTVVMFGSTNLSGGTYSITLARDGGWFKCTNVNLPDTIFYKIATV